MIRVSSRISEFVVSNMISRFSRYLPTLVNTPFSSSIGKVDYNLRGLREKALACSSQLAVAASDLNASNFFHLAHYVGQGVRRACYNMQGWNHSLTLDEPNIMGTWAETIPWHEGLGWQIQQSKRKFMLSRGIGHNLMSAWLAPECYVI